MDTCKCLFQTPLVEILPVGLQESTLPEKLTSVLGQIKMPLLLLLLHPETWGGRGRESFGFLFVFGCCFIFKWV